ncbi:hypothetical protein HanPSC8_Chr06g0268141 [Helianthus annuus]|nr:hypothetical protein HanPSC8_Chr06g0268141 [Helianthus annuus]
MVCLCRNIWPIIVGIFQPYSIKITLYVNLLISIRGVVHVETS